MRKPKTARSRRTNTPVTHDVGTHVPYLLGSIANHLAVTSSILYRSLFNIGLTEWRLMWVLAIDPDITARAASQKVGLDKAARNGRGGGLGQADGGEKASNECAEVVGGHRWCRVAILSGHFAGFRPADCRPASE